MSSHNKDLIFKIERAIEAHKVWKEKLDAAITSRCCEISVAQATCDNVCDFGKWIYGGDLGSDVIDSEIFQEIRAAHAQFHKKAGIVLSGATGGDYHAEAQIEDDVRDYALTSKALLALLKKWKQTLSSGQTNPINAQASNL